MGETVCVTGGSGGFAQALLGRLFGQYAVRILFRKRSAISDAWEKRGCVAVFGDLGDERALAELTSDAKFVFHCAALVGRSTYPESYAVNVAGTRRLAEIAARSGVSR